MVQLTLLLSAGALPAQELVWERVGVQNQYGFAGQGGGFMASLGDLDGDGCGDVIVLGENVADQTNPSQLWILSGVDGHTIRAVPGEGIQLLYGHLAATGDVDGDGVPDYATTVLDVSVAGRAIRLEVRSGVDDRPLWYVENTNSRVYAGLTGNVDLNGDGRPDVACTVPDFEGRRLGAVLAYDHDGHLLWQRPGTPTFPVGWQLAPLSLSGAGDVDDDGADDLLATGFDLETNAGLGIVLSGRTGATLLRVSGPANGPVIGREVAGLGDVDGDGVPDIALGTEFSSFVMAFSGRTGAQLYTWTGTQTGSVGLGHGFASRLDVDLDGIADLVVGAPGGRSSFVLAFSGRDGEEILRLPAPGGGGGGLFGTWVSVIEPQPANPFGLVIVSSPEFGPYVGATSYYQGRIQAYRVAPRGVQPLGPPCEGTLGRAPRIGIRSLSTGGARVHLSNSPPGAAALLLLGRTQGAMQPVALDPFGFPGCALYTPVELAVAVTTGAMDGNRWGYASVDLPLPLATGVPQVIVGGQWLVFGSGDRWPGALSGGLTWGH